MRRDLERGLNPLIALPPRYLFGTALVCQFVALIGRLPALAELAWSPRSAHDWPALSRRLTAEAARWSEAGITFHRAAELPWPVPAQRRADAGSPVESEGRTG